MKNGLGISHCIWRTCVYNKTISTSNIDIKEPHVEENTSSYSFQFTAARCRGPVPPQPYMTPFSKRSAFWPPGHVVFFMSRLSSASARRGSSDPTIFSTTLLFFRVACFPIHVVSQVFSFCIGKSPVFDSSAGRFNRLIRRPLAVLTLAAIAFRLVISILPPGVAELLSYAGMTNPLPRIPSC